MDDAPILAGAAPALDPEVEQLIKDIMSKVPRPPQKGALIQVADLQRSIDLLVAAGKPRQRA